VGLGVKTNKVVVALVLGGALGLVASVQAASVSETLYSVGDAYIDSRVPDTNFGATQQIVVGEQIAGPDKQQVLVKFDLSDIPSGSTVESAKLRMYLGAMTGPAAQVIGVIVLDEEWSETEVKYNNFVGIGATGPTSNVIKGSHWNAWDMVEWVQGWVDGTDDNDGVLLLSWAPGSDFMMSFFSREQGTAPQLLVNYDPPALTVSGISHSDVSTETLDVGWSSNLAASSFVEYGLDDGYGLQAGEDEMVTDHSVGLTGLSPGTVYHYRVKSEDRYGRTTTSENRTVTTQAAAGAGEAASPTPGATTSSAGQSTSTLQPAAEQSSGGTGVGEEGVSQQEAAGEWSQEGDEGLTEEGNVPADEVLPAGNLIDTEESEEAKQVFWLTPVAVVLELVILVTVLTLIGVVAGSVWLARVKRVLNGVKQEREEKRETDLRVENKE